MSAGKPPLGDREPVRIDSHFPYQRHNQGNEDDRDFYPIQEETKDKNNREHKKHHGYLPAGHSSYEPLELPRRHPIPVEQWRNMVRRKSKEIQKPVIFVVA